MSISENKDTFVKRDKMMQEMRILLCLVELLEEDTLISAEERLRLQELIKKNGGEL